MPLRSGDQSHFWRLLYMDGFEISSNFKNRPNYIADTNRTGSLYTVCAELDGSHTMGHIRRVTFDDRQHSKCRTADHRRDGHRMLSSRESLLGKQLHRMRINKICTILHRAAQGGCPLWIIRLYAFIVRGAASNRSNYIGKLDLKRSALFVTIGERRWCAWPASWRAKELES